VHGDHQISIQDRRREDGPIESEGLVVAEVPMKSGGVAKPHKWLPVRF
jgi:hypothetical protein